MRYTLFFLTVLSLVTLCFQGVYASSAGSSGGGTVQKAQNYFSVLPDIPLPDGMKEVEDETFVFDKAEGRVVLTAGYLRKSSSAPVADDVLSYYRSVLSQLGWSPLNGKDSATYVRNGEQLFVSVEKVRDGVLLRLQLIPLSR